MTAAGTLRPAGDRVALIDALRAIALLGVILFNYSGMVLGFEAARLLPRAGRVDMIVALIELVLVQGKARTCFALLFGVGFGILMERAGARGQHFTAFYLRRMTVLLAIGLFNLAFLFWGDILILYALLGMAMLLFRGIGDRALVRLGLALILLPPLLTGLAEGLTGAPLPNLGGLSPKAVDALMPASAPIYEHGGFGAYVAANFHYYLDHYRAETSYAAMYDLGVLGLFMLGLAIARNRLLADVEPWRPLLRRIAWICLPVGLLLSAVHGTRRLGIVATSWAYGGVTAAYAGIAILAFGYAALACLILTRWGRGLLPALAPLGRMALTGYLASNAIGAFTWYGWGLGLIGHWNVAAIATYAVAVYLGLALFSTVWMRAFRFGPAEWVWRSLTYGVPQPMVRPTMAVVEAAA